LHGTGYGGKAALSRAARARPLRVTSGKGNRFTETPCEQAVMARGREQADRLARLA